jgi:hypothetical protein
VLTARRDTCKAREAAWYVCNNAAVAAKRPITTISLKGLGPGPTLELMGCFSASRDAFTEVSPRLRDLKTEDNSWSIRNTDVMLEVL